ncbi:hypothetical protein G6011_08522 [Alternaria panax]|uniref:Uncharacterized protein n=1 Tax=Alternaria panax TaxID=48097 RepID=A0AAD4FH36_9PLEO|nr:hypothetical protein G6011_08522 [Alternaria panax]
MKCQFCFIAFVAFVTAQGIQNETPPEILDEDAYSTSTLYSVPAPSAGYAAPSSDIVVPSALPSKVTSDDSCSTALITITTTRTVSVVTQIPSDLLTVTGIVELSSFMPSQPLLPTSATGIVEISSWVAPEPPSTAVTVIVPESNTADAESNVVAPETPYPTASDTPISTSIVGTTSSMSPGLPVFTDAANAVRVPAVVAGILRWAILVL